MKSRQLLVLLTIALQTQSYAVQLPSSCQNPYSLAEGEAHLRRAADRLAWVIHHKAEVQTALLRGDFERSVDSEKVTTLLKKCAEDIASGAQKCTPTGVALPHRRWRTQESGDIASPGTIFVATPFVLPLSLSSALATMVVTHSGGWESVLAGMAIPGILSGGWALCEDLRLKAFEKNQKKYLKKIYDKNFYGRLQELGITVPTQRREEYNWLAFRKCPFKPLKDAKALKKKFGIFKAGWIVKLNTSES